MEFVERDVERDRAAMDDLRALGLRSVPVTIVGDTRIVGFWARELAEALDLELDPKPRDPAETTDLYDASNPDHRRAADDLAAYKDALAARYADGPDEESVSAERALELLRGLGYLD